MDCFEFSEFPGVEEGIDRKLIFPEIKWLRKAKFEKLVQESIEGVYDFKLYPCLNENSKIENRMYVGKTIPKVQPIEITVPNQNENEVINAQQRQNNNALPFEYLEMIGCVCQPNNSNKWKLIVTHENQVYECDEDFLVLHIKDPISFYWSSNKDENNNDLSFRFNNKKIPKYAFRAAVDKVDCKYSYIGRSLIENEYFFGKIYFENYC